MVTLLNSHTNTPLRFIQFLENKAAVVFLNELPCVSIQKKVIPDINRVNKTPDPYIH